MSVQVGPPGSGTGVGDYEFNPDEPDDLSRLAAFIRSVPKVMDNLIVRPPAGLEGTYIEEQRAAWYEVSYLEGQIVERIYDPDRREDFGRAGLFANAGKAKFRLWDDAVRAFLKLRTVRRSSRLLNVGAAIMASIADIANLGEAWKEAMQGLEYLTDLAISDGGAG